MTNDATKKVATAFAEFRGKWIERALADTGLSPGAFRTLVGLAHHFLNRKERKIWASQDTIATKLNISIRSAQGHLAELQERRLIEVKRKGRDKPNDYFPKLDDTQNLADHDATGEACHRTAKTRKNASDDTQKRVAKTRKDLRTNPLKEPLEEPFEGGGARAPTAVLSDVTISTIEELIALPDDALIPPAASDEAREMILDHLVQDATFKASAKAALGGPYDRGKLSKKIARSVIAEFDDPLIDLKETSREHSA